MEDFKGLSRDTVRAKTPPMQWEFARNILLSKGFLSITNEDGFDYKHDVPGTFIGKIETNEEVVYFSVDGPFSCIGLYRTNEDIPVYVPILRTIYLGFKINRPIEGIFFYNYKGELIVSFCDGVFLDSNTPKIINLTNIGIPLTGAYELINPADIDQLDLTPSILTGDIDISYIENGTFEGEVVYITYSYILADGITPTAYIPIYTVAYPIQNFRQNSKRDVIITLSKLDPNYDQLKIAILVATEGGLAAYESPIRSYNGTDYTTTLSSLTSYTSISTDSLLIPSVVYNRIKTMTLVNSELSIGNLAMEKEIDFQKWANLLTLGLRFDTRPVEKHNHPILCPDEVYFFTISLHLLNGSYSKEYALVGRPAEAGETDDLTNADLIALGIEEIGVSETFKRFRIFNTGGFTIPATSARDIFDAESELKWGYWENQENYPNDDNYNSLVDYDGNPIVGGVDLRNTPIRYHRVPGLDNLVKNFPCIVGENNKNLPEYVENVFMGAVPAFGVSVLNFDSIVPADIKSKIQGYKLSIVKRSRGDSLVEDINFIKQAFLSPEGSGDASDSIVTLNSALGDDQAYPETVRQFGYSKFRSTNLLIYQPQVSAKLIKANYGINTSLHRINAPGTEDEQIDTLSVSFTKGNVGYNKIDDKAGYTLVPDTQRFAVVRDIKYLPANNIAADTLYVENGILVTAHNSLVPNGGFPEDDVPTRWNPLLWTITNLSENRLEGVLQGFEIGLLSGSYVPYNYISATECYKVGISTTLLNLVSNVYSGFSPKEFITIGQVSLRGTVDDYTLENQLLRDCGDIFTNNLYNKIESLHAHVLSGGTLNVLIFEQIVLKGMFAVPNNTEIYMIKDRPYRTVDYDEALLPTYIYQDTIYRKDVFASLNNLIVGIPFSINDQDINYFPYRIQRSLKIANENLSTYNIRTFPANKYYEMLNDRGEIIALRGSNKVLYIQQRFSLFLTSLKDKLTTKEGVSYLGEGDLFDRTPDEVFDASNRGFLGSTSQFACILYRDGYITIDQVKGKMFIVSGGQGLEISKEDMVIWFEENANTDSKYYNISRLGLKQVVDNPYNQVGHLIGFDLKYNRILWTKKDFRFKTESLEEGEVLTFDGEWYYINDVQLQYSNRQRFEELSKTFSFSLDGKKWVCEHDYFPNSYFYTNRGLYSSRNLITLSQVYRHNSKLRKGTYYENETFDSYGDLIFNSRLDLSKLYQNVSWNTVVYDENGQAQYFKTINAIMLYNDVQCTGIIDLDPDTISLERNLEGNWDFNSFRDLVVDNTLPVIDSRGRLIQSNININRSWFEKSNFINTFIVVRMIMKNQTNDAVYINVVNVKSRISDRT